MTGLSEIIGCHYRKALEIILDMEPDDTEGSEDKQQGAMIEKAAVMLYGLIHARYILASKGILEMSVKFNKADFGTCPRVFCDGQHVLPIGLLDVPGEAMVKLYCPKCCDVYTPKSTRHHHIDGSYFGTSFPHMFFMVFPEHRPKPPEKQFVATLYGFKIHPSAYNRQLAAAAALPNNRTSNCRPSISTNSNIA
ncbi:hypothetical protein HAZT_HAZT011608 [Hyalella azteca]|uniref:Casein kinase II subunit beta n=1 Tax=Hyalella azteca TaxID=294128 RepID=A0A6A0GSA7_HYAAZ|nr:hypothetical protein HAZT_HAZT011608 [Hyalella azteca]